ncbi:MAG TPA: hypothetical protein VG890_10840 [Puia sp.]|nr:hypothetical protein [Puia sp.]
MPLKTSIVTFFTRGKVVFATIAAIITFSITLYNQFKSTPTTEISGFVSTEKESVVPVDAVVKIISPIQSQTETDSRGRFKFKLQNIQSDTFLLVVQNKKTNTETKQNEYINAVQGKKDIFVLFNANIDSEKVYAPWGKSTSPEYSHRKPEMLRLFHDIRLPKKRH